MNKRYFEVTETGMSQSMPPEPCIVVIFGATGDLTHRELIPSLYALSCNKLMPKPFAIIGFARREWTDDTFREEMTRSAKKDVACPEEEWIKFLQNIYFVQGNFNDDTGEDYQRLREKILSLQKEFGIPNNILFHLATPPSFYGTIIQKLRPAGLTESEKGWRRVIIEKPFGEDEASARELDNEIHKVIDEDQIYRVDHFLGKETVQNMLVFRFANAGFEPIWNRNYIDNIQITVSEELGIGTRGNFYEKTGILRDMVQNHLLQLLCITAIEPPVHFDAFSLRTETVKVLQSVCKIDLERDVVLGQYGPGEISGKSVPGYRQEIDVDTQSNTPTFSALRLTLDNWRWSGVPFYIRTGKRMPRKLTEVTIQFKPTPHLMFAVDRKKRMRRSILTFRLQPEEGIEYRFMAKQPGADILLQPVNLDFNYATAFGIEEPPSAYQWLIYDAMQGEQTLFPHSDWIQRAWRIIDPIIKKWEKAPWIGLPNYAAGSWGPAEADELIKRDGREWGAR